MWMFRRRHQTQTRNQNTATGLPARCFISHSYQDAMARERLLHALPPSVQPFIFPPITVAPNELISNELIKALMDCDGLIYLESGHSATSFWVAFERDYALRMNKLVFAFDPDTGAIRRDTSSPMDLKVFPSYAHHDFEHVEQVLDFMRRERYFDVFIDRDSISPGAPFANVIVTNIQSRLEAGGYVVVFCSEESARSSWVEREYSFAQNTQYNRQILPVTLDPAPLPRALASIQALQLYGDAERSARQRMDDLIVCLYWLIYQNTHQNRLG